MKSNNPQNEHPEVKDIENICDVSPDSTITKDVCDKVKKSSQQDSNKKGVEKK